MSDGSTTPARPAAATGFAPAVMALLLVAAAILALALVPLLIGSAA